MTFMTYTQVIKTDFGTAQLIKYMANCFFATKVSFMNEMYQVCEAIAMLTDPGTRIEIGTASREWVLAHHDRGVVARKCESMLAALGLM